MSEDKFNLDTLNDEDFDLSDVVTLTKLPSGNSRMCTSGHHNTLNEQNEIKCSIQSVKTKSQEKFDVSLNWEGEPLPSSDVILGISYCSEKDSTNKSPPSTQIESTFKIKPRFPGPAGCLSTDSKVKTTLEFEQNLKGKRTKVIHRNLANLNGLFMWDKALTSLGIQQLWMNSRMNIEMVKSSFTPGALYMTVPLFIVGIQRIDYEPVITHDVNCILQDPSGEERGRILKQVINEFGKLIQVGSILVLRRPSVLKWSTSYMVTVTKSCLIGIYSPENNSKFTQCQEFEKADLLSWLSEAIERGEPMNNEDETSLDKTTITQSVTLFSSTSSFNASRPNMSSPYLNRTPGCEVVNNTAYTLLSNPATPTISRSSSLNKPVHHQLDRINNSNTTPVRSFNNNNSNSVGPFQFKSPSAVFSTARSTPYPQSARIQQPVTSPVEVNENSSAEDELVSQLLEGIDTDELFSGDF